MKTTLGKLRTLIKETLVAGDKMKNPDNVILVGYDMGFSHGNIRVISPEGEDILTLEYPEVGNNPTRSQTWNAMSSTVKLAAEKTGATWVLDDEWIGHETGADASEDLIPLNDWLDCEPIE